ncbi:serine/arginine-rich splicing factor RSZ22-like [Papaver somniferum]|uniref:serine/arginine-rich splicing factor RSZ22-like n=1 Tax=Papaver somniferum TaxID=3469 RepID=UPI000E705FDF|nr:serine/arginine-rich splicing factor RSZ22-like [Papaver somniferum]
MAGVWVARKPPGYAFVELDDCRDALDAINDLDAKNGWGVELSHNSKGSGGGRDGGGGGGRGRGVSSWQDKLVCHDISGGQEASLILVTNLIDPPLAPKTCCTNINSIYMNVVCCVVAVMVVKTNHYNMG